MANDLTVLEVDIDTLSAEAGLGRLDRKIDQTSTQFNKLDRAIEKTEKRAQTFRQVMSSLSLAFGLLGVGQFVKSLVEVNTAFERVRATLISGSNTFALAGNDFDYVRRAATELGMPVKKVGLEFSRMISAAQGTKLEGQAIRDIFMSIGRAFVATGQTQDDFRLGLLAITQMMSKGRVQAEELRRQFGERLPGAWQAAAAGLGLVDKAGSTATAQLDELVRSGKLTADVLLPKLAAALDTKFGRAFEYASQHSPALVMSRFQSAVENLLYTMSKAGFMEGFVGALKKITDFMRSPEGIDTAERFGRALGFLAKMIGAAAVVIVQNADIIVAALAGIAAGGTILAIRALVGWMVTAASASGLIGLMLGPWGMLAAAIGLSTLAVARFGEYTVRSGGAVMRLQDIAAATFDVINDKVQNQLLPAIGALLSDIPVIGPVLKTIGQIAGDVWGVFTDVLETTKDFTLAFEQAGKVFETMFKANISPEDFATFMKVVKAAQEQLAPIATFVRNAFAQLPAAIEVAKVVISQFAGFVYGIFADIVESVASIARTLQQVFMTAFTSISDSVKKHFGSGLGEALRNTFFFIADSIIWVILTIVDVVEMVVNIVGNVFKAIWPIVDGIIDAVANIASAVGDLFGTLSGSTEAAGGLNLIAGAFGIIGEVIGGIIQTVVTFISLVAGIAGPIISMIGDLVSAVGSAIEGLVSIVGAFFSLFFSNTDTMTEKMGVEVPNANSIALDSAAKFGDVFVGAILTVIRVLVLLVQQIGNVIQAIGELASRAGTLLSGLSSGFMGLQTFDFGRMISGAEELRGVFEKPLPNFGFVGDTQAAIGDIGGYFGIVSGAVENGRGARNSFENGMNDIGGNWGRATDAFNSPAARAAQNAAAAEAGQNFGATFLDSMAAEIRDKAAKRTSDAVTAEAEAARMQAELAAQGIDQFNLRQQGVDAMPDPTTSPGGSRGRGNSRGGRSEADRAKDRIAELVVEIATNRALSQAINEESIAREDLDARLEAEKALRKAGYDLTYDQAIATGGLVGQLAALSYEASTSEQEMEKLNKAYKAYQEAVTDTQGIEADIRAIGQSTASHRELKYQLAAQQELQRTGINMTYEEAVAAGEMTRKLVEQIATRERLKAVRDAALNVKSALENYQQEVSWLNQYALAASQSETAVRELTATIAAQKRVMSERGETTWREGMTADEQALYDVERAFVLAGGSGADYANMLQSLGDEFGQLTNPLQQSAVEIERWRTESLAKLDAFYQSIKDRTPGVVAAYTAAFNQISAIADEKLGAVSTNIGERLGYALDQLGKQVDDWAGNMEGAFNNAIGSMTDALTEFVMTGKLEWRDLVTAIIKELIRMLVQWLVVHAIMAAFKIFGFADGGIMGGSGGGGGGTPISGFAKGGVVDSPHLAVFGEGSTPEAFVPLPDGRTIPVTLTGQNSGNSGQPISITLDTGPFAKQLSYFTMALNDTSSLLVRAVSNSQAMPSEYATSYGRMSAITDAANEGMSKRYFDASTPETSGSGSATNVTFEFNNDFTLNGGAGGGGSGSSSQDAEAQKKFMQSMSKQISETVKAQVISVVRDETRPGGMFNRTGRRSGL